MWRGRRREIWNEKGGEDKKRENNEITRLCSEAEWLIDTESFRSAVQVVTAEVEASAAPCKYARRDGWVSPQASTLNSFNCSWTLSLLRPNQREWREPSQITWDDKSNQVRSQSTGCVQVQRRLLLLSRKPLRMFQVSWAPLWCCYERLLIPLRINIPVSSLSYFQENVVVKQSNMAQTQRNNGLITRKKSGKLKTT